MEHYIKKEMLNYFENTLQCEEKSPATIEKYLHDLKSFFAWVGEDNQVTKEKVIQYKRELMENYMPSSVNSMLAALNCFFKKMNWYDCVVKTLKIQREAFRSANRELTRKEYYRLLRAAQKQGKERLSLVMQTICSTGIRVSELKFITVRSLEDGRATVSLKGKIRIILIPDKLCRILRKYTQKLGIKNGPVFITRNGNPLDRSNILHEMKSLCDESGISRSKIFPHNLRHLFAVTYYQIQKDLPHLADLLGHSNVDTTRVYTRVNGKEQAEQINRMGLVV